MSDKTIRSVPSYHKAYKENTIITQFPDPAKLLPSTVTELTKTYAGYRGHQGADSYHKWGATIYATHDGIVSWLADEGNVGGGVWLEISRDGKYSKFDPSSDSETYKHFRRGSVVVKSGQVVKAGEKIGIQGNTGKSFGEHLHYEVRRNGVLVDPVPYFQGTEEQTQSYYKEYEKMLESPKSKKGFMVTAGIWRIQPNDLLNRIRTVFSDAYLEPVTDMKGNKKYEVRVGRFIGTLAEGNKFIADANATFAFGLELWSQ